MISAGPRGGRIKTRRAQRRRPESRRGGQRQPVCWPPEHNGAAASLFACKYRRQLDGFRRLAIMKRDSVCGNMIQAAPAKSRLPLPPGAKTGAPAPNLGAHRSFKRRRPSAGLGRSHGAAPKSPATGSSCWRHKRAELSAPQPAQNLLGRTERVFIPHPSSPVQFCALKPNWAACVAKPCTATSRAQTTGRAMICLSL